MGIAILIHSSKTMRSVTPIVPITTSPLIAKAKELATYVQTLSPAQIQKTMSVSETLARKTHDTWAKWNAKPSEQSLAIDSFVGDIYSGLQANTLSAQDRDYAQQTLRILSGLYGILRPYDGVRPYRLEMGYKLPNSHYKSLYAYWGKSVADILPREGLVVNLSAVEYTKAVLPYIDAGRVVAPRFLTKDAKTGNLKQVIVHTKIARGAFARWLIQNRVTSANDLALFSELNYHYEASLSTPSEPVFVCEDFGGIGLSMRLQKD
jgi:cytoplasmic iron level regulating protein YaaA (DUF328/UPF0246 family)